ncbi:MAG: hypothetical protein SGJ04_07395 [Bacteroidota bacterium]|nr:hypothetical protein [Bacteroidota bacterium]
MSTPDTTLNLDEELILEICAEYAQGNKQLYEVCQMYKITEAAFHQACEGSLRLHHAFLHSQRILHRLHLNRWTETARTRLQTMLTGYMQKQVITDEDIDAEGNTTLTRRRSIKRNVQPGLPALTYTLNRLESIIQKQQNNAHKQSEELAAILQLPENGRTYKLSV